ncbi:exonuclease subunit SbcD [Azospirillum sp. RWY-5-1]|uniref:Nuclease SbcCD subunit D n=1 Tax=Azospirillum oleiclasticum TaxID=2735135 RepID=A0ABX2TN57_9PROT|nr:exonuclease SbcCD subunit D C-terminal domain-containing protein [Azospirillum oleiclasticum]NYZ18032.1 exonuclease subunit SbcD [Azospirillum oleiclasticum]NYZ25188.1 exonuclease subunit SbcD [Azospirillum oleiclasticum]
MRLLHTADWHLGQTLHGVSREHEHQHFLDWLLDRLEEHAVDALVIAGDLFDGQNPPITALAQFYRFVAAAKGRLPDLDIVAIAGNHDSGSRLEAPSPLLDAMGVRIVGSLPVDGAGAFDPERAVLALTDRTGAVAARCVVVPYLRPADLPAVDEAEGDPLIEGVRRLYAAAAEAGRARLRPGEALILTGHCYMGGGELSDLSERKILGGNLHALPADIFCADAAYVALGHLHRPQAVGGRDGVRYSGSPIPLALDEEPYPHQVVLAEFAAGRLVERRALRVPRVVEIRRVPGNGAAAEPEAALAALRALPLDPALPPERWPYLEVTVALPEPRPGLRDEVEAALAGRPVRLLKLTVRPTGDGRTLAESAVRAELSDLSPEDVFRRIHARRHESEPDPALLAAFHELLEDMA